MKIYLFALIYLLISFTICEINVDSDVTGESLKEENEKKFKEKINTLLKKLGINDKKLISKNEFRNIFGQLFDSEKVNNRFINQIYDKLTADVNDQIEVEKINQFFEPMKILNALKDAASVLGLDKMSGSISEHIEDKENKDKQQKRKVLYAKVEEANSEL